MNVINGNVINNYYGTNEELVEFQKLNLFETEELNELIYNSLNGEHEPFAEIGYYYYKKEYNYGEDENWYEYKNNKWEKIGKRNALLKKQTCDKGKQIYNTIIKYYRENDNDIKKINKLEKIYNSLDNAIFRNNIMLNLTEIYLLYNNSNKDFVKNLDINNNLIGFTNGVYDLYVMKFREGDPSDNISMSTGYDYIEKYSENYKELVEFLNDIQPTQEDRDYMLMYLSTALYGNTLELFTILTGVGRNGKSKLIELIKLTFGNYFSSVPSQMFTRPRPNASSPDPGLLNLSKKKIVIASEPEKNYKLNSGFIKFITGRDTSELRNCHSNDIIEFSPKFITLLVCNDIPEIDEIDNAFSNRLRTIHFKTEFVDNPTTENQKKINIKINEKFNKWKSDFMLLLIGKYKEFIETENLKPTYNILKWTNKYKYNNNIYLQFLSEKTEPSTKHISSEKLYNEFESFHYNNISKKNIPNNIEFYRNMEKLGIPKVSVRVDNMVTTGMKNLQIKK
jgi:P4 family phage/plasmid primase-like protien